MVRRPRPLNAAKINKRLKEMNATTEQFAVALNRSASYALQVRKRGYLAKRESELMLGRIAAFLQLEPRELLREAGDHAA